MRAAADHPRVIAPPPLLALGAILIGGIVDRFVPLPLWPADSSASRLTVAVVIIALSVAISIAALSEMRRHRTSPNPYEATTAVVSTGVYRHTRNPIYLGFLLLVVGVGLIVNTVWIAVALLPLFVALDAGVVRREERYLVAKFDGAYEAYRARVRRWV